MGLYYPVFLIVSGKRCVVIGGGQVALRKVKTLLECKAKVKVISPKIGPGLKRLARDNQIEVNLRNYRLGDLKGAIIVIAATNDSRTNIKVAKEAQREGLLVNVVDDADSSNFISSSYLSRGDITIAISTSGRAPALARKLRLKLEKEFGEEYASLAQVVHEVREEIKQQGIKINRNVWQDALDLDVLVGLIKQGALAKAKRALLNSLQSR